MGNKKADAHRVRFACVGAPAYSATQAAESYDGAGLPALTLSKPQVRWSLMMMMMMMMMMWLMMMMMMWLLLLLMMIIIIILTTTTTSVVTYTP
jgi:hypothetical protein